MERQVRNFSHWNFSICTECQEQVLKTLSENLKITVFVGACNCYDHYHKGPTKTIRIIGWYYPKSNQHWKFTNESRRKIIRVIKESYGGVTSTGSY